MPAAVALNGDTIGGVAITTAVTPLTKFDGGKMIVRDGDSLPSHGIGPHAAPTAIANALQTLIVEGKKIVRVSVDPASCGDTISPVGPHTVIVGP